MGGFVAFLRRNKEYEAVTLGQGNLLQALFTNLQFSRLNNQPINQDAIEKIFFSSFFALKITTFFIPLPLRVFISVCFCTLFVSTCASLFMSV